MSEYVHIPIDQDPEDLADALIADSLPLQSLDELRLESALDAMSLLVYLNRRSGEAAIEKEETIGFAEANRRIVTPELLDLLERSVANAGVEKPLEEYFTYIISNVRHAVAGDYAAIDLRSDRLLWLLVALSMQLASEVIDYEAALAVLTKPEHTRHISPAALQYRVLDYVSSLESANTANTEYIMLVCECALATRDIQSLKLGWIALRGSSQPRDTRNWVGLIDRASRELAAHGELDAPGMRFAEKVHQRFAAVDEDDF